MVFLGNKNSKCQLLAKFQFWGVFLGCQNLKCQLLAKFQLGGILGQSKLKVPIIASNYIPPKLSDDSFEVARGPSLSPGPPDPPGF